MSASDASSREPSQRSDNDVSSPTVEDSYEVKVLAGNHGSWLFVRRNDSVVYEQAGMASDEEAQEFGALYIERDREVRAKARACEHQWPEQSDRFGGRRCELCAAMKLKGSEDIILPRPKTGPPRVIVDAERVVSEG